MDAEAGREEEATGMGCVGTGSGWESSCSENLAPSSVERWQRLESKVREASR
jgi:hypothetical protein